MPDDNEPALTLQEERAVRTKARNIAAPVADPQKRERLRRSLTPFLLTLALLEKLPEVDQ